MTKVVHVNYEPYDVLIDRTTKWGNPYSHKEGTLAEFKVASRKEAIEKFREYLYNNEELLSSIEELRGKTLGCWCKNPKNPKACHGDIYVEYLNKRLIL